MQLLRQLPPLRPLLLLLLLGPPWLAQGLLSLPDGIESMLGFKPKSSFKCDRDGYFGDPDTDCRLFHLCQRQPSAGPGGRHEWRHWTYACGNQTMFNQLTLTCAFVDEAIPCRHANQFAYLNEVIHKPREPFLTDADVTSGQSYYSNRVMSDGARARAFEDPALMNQLGGASGAGAGEGHASSQPAEPAPQPEVQPAAQPATFGLFGPTAPPPQPEVPATTPAAEPDHQLVTLPAPQHHHHRHHQEAPERVQETHQNNNQLAPAQFVAARVLEPVQVEPQQVSQAAPQPNQQPDQQQNQQQNQQHQQLAPSSFDFAIQTNHLSSGSSPFASSFAPFALAPVAPPQPEVERQQQQPNNQQNQIHEHFQHQLQQQLQQQLQHQNQHQLQHQNQHQFHFIQAQPTAAPTTTTTAAARPARVRGPERPLRRQFHSARLPARESAIVMRRSSLAAGGGGWPRALEAGQQASGERRRV